MGDLVMVNDKRGVFRLQDLMKASIKVLENRGLRSAYKAGMTNGMSVVVKNIRDMNKIGRDVFDVEMRHKNILGPFVYQLPLGGEKLFITDYMPKDSLFYVTSHNHQKLYLGIWGRRDGVELRLKINGGSNLKILLKYQQKIRVWVLLSYGTHLSWVQH
ncbi:hypothetical protein AHAS_Ahas04G0229500 [Arachis hypogaea]